ncbi:S-formylglutathione hydrolase [Pseudohongiella spirulinae]|uniref:S-formylglutathione hydrolase n=2 Tax=Pseudohongiella spirulinae TaxID=1249552 RepID=A0A0S2KBB8_9GAMM|nr:S-formylglutathione hydrolase [Pseudohongiella spirulinae]
MSSENSSLFERVSDVKTFGGRQIRVRHQSAVLNCEMHFSVFLPPAATDDTKVPSVYFLSGLTCSDENFSTKAGAQRVAAELGLALVIPDTSPRGDAVADDESYDLGQGAGFYLNATQAPWSEHYRMYDYITEELPTLVDAHFPVTERKAISGHSMGGHGAISIACKLPKQYSSVSAFSPIVNPMVCPWGEKAFTHYLGAERSTWAEYDSVELLRSRGLDLPLLVDQGSADGFLEEQLLTDNLVAVSKHLDHVQIRMQTGYDHSYYFIATFIEAHLRFHAQHLSA